MSFVHFSPPTKLYICEIGVLIANTLVDLANYILVYCSCIVTIVAKTVTRLVSSSGTSADAPAGHLIAKRIKTNAPLIPDLDRGHTTGLSWTSSCRATRWTRATTRRAMSGPSWRPRPSVTSWSTPAAPNRILTSRTRLNWGRHELRRGVVCVSEIVAIQFV